MMIKVMVTRMILVDDGDLWSMMLVMTYFGLIYFSLTIKNICIT